MNTNEKLALVKRNTEEIITEEDLIRLLETKKKLSAYYGVAPTGSFHIAYLIPLSKVFDLNKIGITTKILIADIHAAMDDLKTPWEEIDKRAEYYKKCIELSFPWEKKPEIVIGSSFQLKKEYITDVLKISSIMTVNRAERAASEVTRMKNPKVSELIYPIMQILDEQYLDIDIQIGGIDQRHIMAAARDYLPKIGYKPRVELMTPLVASLKGPGTKMSASIPGSFIRVHDNKEEIEKNIKNAYCPEGDIKDNSIIQLAKFIAFPIKGKLKIERPAKWGGDLLLDNYEELEKAFVSKQLHPADLKQAVSNALIEIFSKAREYFEKDKI